MKDVYASNDWYAQFVVGAHMLSRLFLVCSTLSTEQDKAALDLLTAAATGGCNEAMLPLAIVLWHRSRVVFQGC